jgi:enamine deaminase RidA (YjgF/YER057c/UK114 family)
MPKQVINPPELFNSVQYGFSQIAIGEGRRLVTISGQVGWDENERIVGDDLRSQTMKAFSNLQIAISAAGGGMDDILSLRIYIVASVMDQSAAVGEALRSYFPSDPPTTNWIGVACLSDAEFLVEVEALAVVA